MTAADMQTHIAQFHVTAVEILQETDLTHCPHGNIGYWNSIIKQSKQNGSAKGEKP